MSARSASVLVIDDNADLAENIGEILEDLGIDVHVATNTGQALAALELRPWSLVVTDVRMPGLDGIELLARIKERSPGTPVLVMTGYADRETVARAHQSGALAVVHKPLDLDALLVLVEHVAAASRSILVVDDDVALVGNLTDILREEQGVLPHPATNLALARRLIGAIDFQVAMIDLRLPDGDGMVLVRELLQREDGSRRLVIVMTGYPEQLAELGTDARDSQPEGLVVLTKPFPIPKLLDRLRALA